jgi:class 3 adenylate cyclase
MESGQLHPLTLAFKSRQLESEYWQRNLPRMRSHNLLAVGVVLLLYTAFAFLDPWIVPEVSRQILAIRAVIFALCVALMLLTYSKHFERYHQPLIASLPLIGGYGILMMIAIAGDTGRQLYYAALILAMIWTLNFSDLRFAYALPIAVVYILSYEAIALALKPLPAPVLVNNSFFLLGALVMCGSAGYTLERTDRLNFCQSLVIDLERQRAERLLLNILPKEIADSLKDRSGTIAQHYEHASILFADIVDFTPLSIEMTPEEMVELLNETFSFFDALVEKYGLEKIRTIGDNYMVAAGLPRPRPDHAQALASMALEMRAYANGKTLPERKKLQFRIGINSGPVVAGVIGQMKFQYDVWGEAVNTASRMESQGLPGQIQITQQTYELIKDQFVCQPRGLLPVKGLGQLPTYLLLGSSQTG